MKKGNRATVLHLILILGLFISGSFISIASFAQDPQSPAYNQYETRAGTSTVPLPPRHDYTLPEKTVKEDNKEIYRMEKKPEYPGGNVAMQKFVYANLRYPDDARLKKITGKVFVGFTIKADGSVANVEAMRGIGGGCDEEAVRVIRLMPKWKPGENMGTAVEVSMVLPVQFPPEPPKEIKKQ